jgi:hypothetical protein
VYLVDGAVELWNLYDGYLARPLGPDVVKLVDFWHVAEYLSVAAMVLETRQKAWPLAAATSRRRAGAWWRCG